MKPLFNDPLHDRLGTWPLGYIPYGGADYGEVVAVANAIGESDDAAFHRTWQAAGNRLASEAENALAEGHRASSRELLLRAACCCHGKSFHPLFGKPADPCVLLGHRGRGCREPLRDVQPVAGEQAITRLAGSSAGGRLNRGSWIDPAARSSLGPGPADAWRTPP